MSSPLHKRKAPPIEDFLATVLVLIPSFAAFLFDNTDISVMSKSRDEQIT